jgi:peptidyl-prolyl cis-trans isomerase D
MLEAIRAHTGSFVVKLLFILLIISFGAWGIGDIIRTGVGKTSVASVGKVEI